MGVVLVFSGQSLNNVMTDRLELDASILRERGHNVIIADLRTIGAAASGLPDPADIDLVIGYQAWGHNIKTANGRTYVEEANCPFVVTLGDHPIHHAQRIFSCPQNTVFCVSSKNQEDFLKDILQVRNDVRLIPSSTSKTSRFESVERDLGAVIVGNATSPDDFLASHKLPLVLEDIVREYMDLGARNPCSDPVAEYMKSGYERVLRIVGGHPSALNVGRLVDISVRHDFRWRYSQALRALPVTFVGDVWAEASRQAGDQFSALPSMSYGELGSVYARASLCLNLHPPYFDFHERIIDASVQGCPVATPQTEWLKQYFSFGEDMLALPPNPDDAPSWMSGLLHDVEELAVIGCRAEAVVAERLGPQLPVDHFLEVMQNSQVTPGERLEPINAAL